MRWVEVNQLGEKPLARSSHTLTPVGDQLYLVGGEHIPREPLTSGLYRFDLQQQKWDVLTASGQAPPARVGHTAAAVGSRILVFGGRVGSPVADRDVGDLHTYDTRAGSWSSLEAAGAPPTARSYHAAAVVGDSMYVFGGCSSGGRLNSLHRYDARQNKWEEMPDNPAIADRGGAGLVDLDNKLYLIGGFNGQELGDVHVMDVSTSSWLDPSYVEHVPPRSVFGIGAHLPCEDTTCKEPGIFIFGGEAYPTDLGHAGAGTYTNEVLGFWGATTGWRRLSPSGTPPSPRGWLAAACMPTCLVVHGGNSPSNERLGDMHVLHFHE